MTASAQESHRRCHRVVISNRQQEPTVVYPGFRRNGQAAPSARELSNVNCPVLESRSKSSP
jgi:hypothetical protein